ncbi:MAG: N-acyl-L-homoserine lactone synthetase, partial [Pseudomonadota bacterium]
RLFVSHRVPANIRRRVHARLVFELAGAARRLGATHCLTLLNANWPRWAKRVGVKMDAMGPVMEIEGVNNQVVSMDFTESLH